MEFSHISVLLHETVDALPVREGGVYLDGTLGGGGHSALLLSKLPATARLLGVDQDKEAISAAKKRLSNYQNVTYINDNFKNVRAILAKTGVKTLAGAMLDLGISSYQIDNRARGFSYMEDAPLDMRMDQQAALSAYDVVNGYDEDKLSDIFFRYGEERFSRRIAAHIVKEREKAPIKTTLALSSLVQRAVPQKSVKRGSHPAKRVFQAIRIEVNGELGLLPGALNDIFDALEPGGRLAVITFHSLEDRIVKSTFLEFAKGCTCPKEFPICVCGARPRGVVVTKKPVVPTMGEIEANSRAKSAKLRVVEKLEPHTNG